MNILRFALVALLGAVLAACETVQPRSSGGPQSPLPAPSIPSIPSGGQSGSAGQSRSPIPSIPSGGQTGQSSSGSQAGQGDAESGDPFGDESEGAGSRQANSAGEDAFGDSLEEFDETFGGEQDEVARAGGGSAADEDSGSDGADDAGGPGEQVAGGPLPEDPRIIPGRSGPGVDGCNDADVVAKQLCEIATQEEDPFLKAALWDEYNEYRRLLARQ